MSRGRTGAGIAALLGAGALALFLFVNALISATAHRAMTLPIISPAPWVSPAPLQGTIDLNSADEETLVSLPGIGEHLAGLIIEARERCPFQYLEDLGTIPGIGDRRLEAIRPLVCILPPE